MLNYANSKSQLKEIRIHKKYIYKKSGLVFLLSKFLCFTHLLWGGWLVGWLVGADNCKSLQKLYAADVFVHRINKSIPCVGNSNVLLINIWFDLIRLFYVNVPARVGGWGGVSVQ